MSTIKSEAALEAEKILNKNMGFLYFLKKGKPKIKILVVLSDTSSILFLLGQRLEVIKEAEYKIKTQAFEVDASKSRIIWPEERSDYLALKRAKELSHTLKTNNGEYTANNGIKFISNNSKGNN